MNKFTTWARRAEHRANHRLAAFDPRRLLGMRKSPLTAAAYGTGGANLGLLNREAQALHDTVKDGLEAMLAHSTVLRQPGGGHSLSTEQRGLLLLREAVLKHWGRISTPRGEPASSSSPMPTSATSHRPCVRPRMARASTRRPCSRIANSASSTNWT
ncbi:hypothetical protein ACKZDW_04090 (plasmid) [Ralstonia syzygii subsp. celebesensis]|uniref:hypothetical protein n=1 Tax=Ralstonia syzygii TaxID=28097 RepID=UPI00387E07A0